MGKIIIVLGKNRGVDYNLLLLKSQPRNCIMASEVKFGPAVFVGMLAQPFLLLGEQNSVYETLLKVDELVKPKLDKLREACKANAKFIGMVAKEEREQQIIDSKINPIKNDIECAQDEIFEVWVRGNALIMQLNECKDRFDDAALPVDVITDKNALEDKIIEIGRLLKIFKINYLDATTTKNWCRKNIIELKRDFCSQSATLS